MPKNQNHVMNIPAPKVRKLLIKTRKMWGNSSLPNPTFYSGVVLCPETNVDAENFCFDWIKHSRLKRLRKGT